MIHDEGHGEGNQPVEQLAIAIGMNADLNVPVLFLANLPETFEIARPHTAP